jgi:hypothetical protein
LLKWATTTTTTTTTYSKLLVSAILKIESTPIATSATVVNSVSMKFNNNTKSIYGLVQGVLIKVEE